VRLDRPEALADARGEARVDEVIRAFPTSPVSPFEKYSLMTSPR
jgi:hypothetical protein